MTSFLDLHSDIILYHFLPKLDYTDIRSVLQIPNKKLQASINSPFIYQLLFKKQFGDDKVTPLAINSNNWSKLFEARRTSQFCTWGDDGEGRLGYRVAKAPRENVDHRGWSDRVVRPTAIRDFKSEDVNKLDIVIIDICAGGSIFQVLTGEGNVFTVGYCTSFPGPSPVTPDPQVDLLDSMSSFSNTSDKELWNVALARVRPGYYLGYRDYFSDATINERSMAENNKFITFKTFPPSINTKNLRIINISSGRAHFIGLDSKNQVWTWENDSVLGVRLKFERNKKSIFRNSKNIITRILAGWLVSSCYIQGIGIVVWNTRESVKSVDALDEAVNAKFIVIPNTSATEGPEKVIDYCIGEGFMVYCTGEGKLYRVDYESDDKENGVAITHQAFQILSFNHALKKLANSSAKHVTNAEHKFVRVAGTFRNFAAFTNHDNVLIGSRDSTEISHFEFDIDNFAEESKPKIFEELQYKNVINVAVGDYHFLALCANGDLYSWGRESQMCGSLGLGPSDVYDGFRDCHTDGLDYVVDSPKKIELNGKSALAITAAGWHSGAILASLGENDEPVPTAYAENSGGVFSGFENLQGRNRPRNLNNWFGILRR